MPRYLNIAFGCLVALVLVGGPLGYYSYHNHCFRNFRVVEEGVLYRSAQLNLTGLQRIIHDYGIKTVISLRDGEKANDIDEEHYLTTQTEIKFVRIPPRPGMPTTGRFRRRSACRNSATSWPIPRISQSLSTVMPAFIGQAPFARSGAWTTMAGRTRKPLKR